MAQHFNLNEVDIEQLSHIRQVGRRRAEEIINYRNAHGAFKSWEDLDKVPGLSKGMIEELKRGGATLDGGGEERGTQRGRGQHKQH